jgi:hypothetical protein
LALLKPGEPDREVAARANLSYYPELRYSLLHVLGPKGIAIASRAWKRRKVAIRTNIFRQRALERIKQPHLLGFAG